MIKLNKYTFFIVTLLLTFSFIKIHQIFNEREYLESDGDIFNIAVFEDDEKFYFEKINNIKLNKLNLISKIKEKCIENTDPYSKKCYKIDKKSSVIKVETEERDNDSILWSYYFIRDGEVFPEKIRKSSFDIVFPSMAWAFISVSLLYLIIFFARKWLNKRKYNYQIDRMQ